MILHFSGELYFWKGPSPFHFVAVPADESAQVQAIASGVTQTVRLPRWRNAASYSAQFSILYRAFGIL